MPTMTKIESDQKHSQARSEHRFEKAAVLAMIVCNSVVYWCNKEETRDKAPRTVIDRARKNSKKPP